MSKCPVDHGKQLGDSCPVDQSARSTWGTLFGKGGKPADPPSLSTDREISSIPKTSDENWVYPSEVQFFAAMARKNHNPHAPDMKTIVPIHNAVNERAWVELMKWEAGRGGGACGGVKLVNFRGRPNDMSPKARVMTLLGSVKLFSMGMSSSFPAGILHPLTGMTGWSSVAGHAYVMLSIFTLVGELEQLRIILPSTWTCARHWTTGRVSK